MCFVSARQPPRAVGRQSGSWWCNRNCKRTYFHITTSTSASMRRPARAILVASLGRPLSLARPDPHRHGAHFFLFSFPPPFSTYFDVHFLGASRDGRAGRSSRYRVTAFWDAHLTFDIFSGVKKRTGNRYLKLEGIHIHIHIRVRIHSVFWFPGAIGLKSNRTGPEQSQTEAVGTSLELLLRARTRSGSISRLDGSRLVGLLLCSCLGVDVASERSAAS